jgi:hypothetical protein
VIHVPAGTVERSTEKEFSLVELSVHVRRAEEVVMSETARADGAAGAAAAVRVRPETWAERSALKVPLKAWTR